MARRLAFGTLWKPYENGFGPGISINAVRALDAANRSVITIEAGSRDVIIHSLFIQVGAPAGFTVNGAVQVGILNLTNASTGDPIASASATVNGVVWSPRISNLTPSIYPLMLPTLVVRTGLRGDTDFSAASPPISIPATAPADVLNTWAGSGFLRVTTGTRLFICSRAINLALTVSAVVQEVDNTAGPLE